MAFWIRNHRRRVLVAAVVLTSGMAAGPAPAQDRRAVSEPGLPTQVCATLSPRAAGGSGGDDTERLQAAIRSCPSGQAVHLVADPWTGRFASGPLVMTSGVTLWLDRGVVLAAIPDPRAFDRGSGRCGTTDDTGRGCRPFILFDRTQGGGLVGEGVVDGQGGEVMAGRDETWWQLARRAQREASHQNNPRLVDVNGAQDITFYQVTLRNSPNFHVALNRVSGATFWDVRIDTPADARNTDGIDPGASEDITIAHSFIRTGDDNIAIKAGHGPTRHVTIAHSHLYWGHGLSIGSETNAGVNDVLVRDVTLDGTTSGLRIKSDVSRGGLVRAIRYEDVCLRGNQRPVDFDTRYDRGARGQDVPLFRDIVLNRVQGGSGAIVLRGFDRDAPLGVTFDSVRFDPSVRWQVEHADLATTPADPGAPAASCDAAWVPFPDPEGGRSGLASPAFPGAIPAATPRLPLTVGPGQAYPSIQAAADAARPGDTILIRPGLYREVVHLRTPDVRLLGTGPQAEDVVIEAARSAADSGGTMQSATVFAQADGLAIQNLMIANRFHEQHPELRTDVQAVALSATGDRQRFTGLRLLGWQDTLHAGSHGCPPAGPCPLARQYYEDVLIEGAIDFAFGDALAWFERPELRGVNRAQVVVTAQGRRGLDQPSGFVFHACRVTADDSVQAISLGRPWRDAATVSYLGCHFDGRVLPEGFTEWQGQQRLKTARYLIADGTGPGARALGREPWLVPTDATALAAFASPQRFFSP